ncbi:hypothetical protein [Desulfocurvus sp. DL9XJH121]
MLDIQSSEYTYLDGAPALRLVIDGKDAYVCGVRKPLLDAGFVYLISLTPGLQWEDELPVATVPATPGLCATDMRFPGVTDDPEVLRLTRAFLAALRGGEGRGFKPGPVS